MYSTIHDRSIALDNRIEEFVNLIQDHYGIGPPEDPASKSSVRLLNPFPFLLLLRHPCLILPPTRMFIILRPSALPLLSV